MVRCIVVPGRGTLDCKFEHWYGWLESRLNDTGLFDEVILPEMMPDPVVASEHEWVPFLRGLGVDEETVVVGHSSGGAAARAAKESEIPNFKGSYLGRFPLVSDDFWTSI